MTPTLTINLLRSLFVVFMAVVGGFIGEEVGNSLVGGLALGVAFGLAVVLADRLLKGISLRVFSSATLGLLIGVIFARLVLNSNVLRNVSEDTQWIIGLLVYSVCGYLGMMLAVRSNRDEFALIIPYVRFRQATVQDEPLVVDSNIIIDGRLPALCATGFVSSSLVVPRFVLEELQRLADSADPLKRERGRAALDRLQAMQRDPGLSITVHETEVHPDSTVDSQLLQLAKMLRLRLLTNDSNLAAIARIQGVTVLNLNDLARSLRPIVEPGQMLELTLSKEGREAHQAVGYLPDGTMIVVNHGRSELGRTVTVVITTSLQTSAGRLYFADLRGRVN